MERQHWYQMLKIQFFGYSVFGSPLSPCLHEFDNFNTSFNFDQNQCHSKLNHHPQYSKLVLTNLVFCFRCKSLTMACLSVPKCTSQMQHFSAHDTAHFNDDIFNAAFNYFPKLQLLDMPGLKLFSRTCIESLIKEHPSRIIIHQEKVYISQQMKAQDLLKMSKNRIFLSLNRFQPDRYSFILKN